MEKYMTMLGVNDVEDIFGARFRKYCEDRKIVLKKVNGAFEVPSIKALANCQDGLDESCHKMDMTLQEIQNRVIEDAKIESCICKEIFPNEMSLNRKKPHLSGAHGATTKMNLQIYLRDSVQTIPTRLPEDMPGFIKLSRAKSGKEVFKTFQRYVRKEHRPALASLALKLSEVLEHFRRLHKNFKYYSCLKDILKKTQKNTKAVDLDRLSRPDIPTVSIDEIKTFLATVFRKVVPKKLFGTVKNRRAIVHALFEFVSAPHNARLDLNYYANHLKIKDIIWLKPISEESVRRSIFASMLLWFFRAFIDKVLHSQVIVLTRKDQRVFVRRWDWHRLQRQFLRKQRKKKILLNYIHERGWKPPKVCYKLVPDVQYNAIVMRDTVKRVRPIVSFRYSDKQQRRDIYLIHTFLRQLYAFKFGTETFQEQWRSVRRNFSGDEMYIVSTDVRNAFGSIVLERLFSLIVHFTEDLPDTLNLVHIARWTKTVYQQGIVSFREFFSHKNLPLPFSSRTLFAHNNWIQPVNISKKCLLDKIQKYIFHQRVFIGNKIYLVGRGVVQGTKVSPILSDIYYASILQKRIEKTLVSCKVIRYVDDVVFVSSSETSAKRFFKLTKTGIRKYGCYFKNKTLTNLSGAPIEQHSTFHGFLGLRIDSRNLQLLPDYAEARQQYPSFKPNSSRNIQFLAEKLKDPYCLKLPSITLDSRINSISTITRILIEAFAVHAKYILHILQRSFTVAIKPETATRLIRLLTIHNKKNMRRIVRFILAGDTRPTYQSAENWIQGILKIFITAYEPVFHYINSITEVPAL